MALSLPYSTEALGEVVSKWLRAIASIPPALQKFMEWRATKSEPIDRC